MQLKHSTEIACTPDRVWTWIEEPDKQIQCMKGVVSNESTNDVTGVGATFPMKIKEGRKISAYDGEITKWEPHRFMSVELVGGCFKATQAMQVDYELTETHTGTRLDYSASADMGDSLLWKLMGPLFTLFGRFQIKSFFRRLKELAEAEGEPVAV